MLPIGRFFLRAKHWQVFALLCGVMVGAQLLIVISRGQMRPPTGIQRIGFMGWIAMASVTGCFLGWLWSLGSFLNGQIQTSLRPRMWILRFSLVFTAIDVLVCSALGDRADLSVMPIVLPAEGLGFVFMTAILYFVAKNLLLAEGSSGSSAFEVSVPFLLLWWFPIGIWFLQPRINKLYARSQVSSIGTAGHLSRREN